MGKEVRFNGARIRVDKGVFNPRAETEFWTKKALAIIKKKRMKNPLVLDIFAGTGCVGLSVLKGIRSSSVHFADSSEKAVLNIEKNLELNRVPETRWRIFQSDMFQRISSRYDFILANPPYVARNRVREVEKAVLESDPEKALFAGEKGLEIIERFIREVGGHLKEQGLVFMEFDPRQRSVIQTLVENRGLNHVFFKDQFDKWRWVCIST